MKPSNKLSKLLALAILLFCQVRLLSCSWSVGHQNRLLVTDKGIAGLIEINMTLDEFIAKGIAYEKMPSPYW